MKLKTLYLFFLCSLFAYAGAAFETDQYLIWISSKCQVGSTTCKDVSYRQIDKSSGEVVEILGGQPVVGKLSAGLIGYIFHDAKNKRIFELSIDLNSQYTLFIRTSKYPEKYKAVRISDADYQQKLMKIKRK